MFKILAAAFAFAFLASATTTNAAFHENYTQVGIVHVPVRVPANNCVQFSVSSGTGCAWMCNYCANQLGTFNYYFPDNVCTYQTGGCVGNPIAGNTYSCCSV